MRRDFLKLCGLAGLGLAVPFRPSDARGAEKKDEPYGGPYYVVFNASGGWDTTYLMDPKGVNGINRLYYSVNNHSPGARYMATGKLDSLAYPTFAALVAACRGPECPLAFLTFGNYSSTGNLVAMSRVPYLPSLKKIALADAVEGNERSPYHDKFALDRIEEALREENQAANT